MSENTNETGKNSCDVKVVEKLDETMNSTLYEKPSSPIESASTTYKELCLTLKAEQEKLLELEKRRLKLHEEMQLLKIQIGQDRATYRVNMEEIGLDGKESVDSISSTDAAPEDVGPVLGSAKEFVLRQQVHLQQMSTPLMPLPRLTTCFEEDEDNEEDDSEPEKSNSQEAIKEIKEVESVAANIRKQLQSVVAECIIEQCKEVDNDSSDEKPGTSGRC